MRLGHTPSGVRCVVFLLVLFGTSCEQINVNLWFPITGTYGSS